MDDLIEELQNLFKLAEITESDANDWAEANYLDFSEVEPPEALTDGTCLDSLEIALRELEKADLPDGRELWKQLVKAEVIPVALAGYLWVIIEVSLKKESQLEHVKCGALASSIYMRLCAINGASTYKFYQPGLVQKVLTVWRLVFRVVIYGARSVDERREKDLKKGKKKLKKVEDEDAPVHDNLPRPEMLKILKKSAMDLFIFLQVVSLADQPELAIGTASYVGDIAQIDFATKEIKIKAANNSEEFETLNLFCERSLALCHILAHGRHSTDCSLIYERIVQPRLLLWSWQNTPHGGNANISISFINYGEAMLRFVEQRIAIADQRELEMIDELIYALTVRCPDRAEYRARIPHTIISLIKMLPAEKFFNYRFVLWDLSTRNNSMGIIIELCVLLINEFDWTLPDPYVVVLEKAKEEKEKATKANDIKEEMDSEHQEDVDMDETNRRKERKKKHQERDVLRNSMLADTTQPVVKTTGKAKKESEIPYFPKGKAILFRILVGALVHTSSTIRSRALCLVADLLRDKSNLDSLKDAAFDLIFAFTYADDIVFDEGARPSVNPTAIDRLFPILTMCCRDEKTQVRKAATLCLEKYLPYVNDTDFSAAIEILKRLCLDESHVVRKQAADGITCLLAGVEEKSDRWHAVANSWILNVFPLIGDSDATVAELVAKLVLELVLNPLIEASKGKVQVQGLAAEILRRIYPGSSSRSEFIRALRDQASHNRLNSIIVNNVQRQLENSTIDEDTSELWTLLECLIMVFPDKIDPKLVFNKWLLFTQPPRSLNNWIPTPTISYGKTASSLLSMIRLIKKKFTSEDRQLLCKNLEGHLKGYTVPVDFINEVWLTLATLVDHQKGGDIKQESKELRKFSSEMYRFALGVIKDIWKAPCLEEKLEFLKYPIEEQAETFLVRMLIGTGYAAQYNLDVIYLLDKDEIGDISEEPLLISFLLKITTDSLSDLRFRLKENRKNIKLDKGPYPFGLPTKRNGKWAAESDWLSQRLTHSDVISNFPMKKFSDKIRAAAATAVGTHCIFDGELTREFLPELVSELQASSSAAVRANLLVPCCDMVKRFAATDIQGLPDALAIVLLDPHPHIRTQCLQMITHLIKEQFVKWEGMVMHLYTIMCIDESPETASFAQSSLQNALLPLMDDMLYANFMEFLLFYNNAPYTWDEENGLINATRRRIRVDGYGSDASRFIWRQTVLRFILTTFTDLQRFGTMVRMCDDIIVRVAKGKYDITDYTISNLVNDCFELMACDEMSFSYALGKKTASDADGAYLDDEPNDAIHAKATEALMKAYREGLQQRILPVLFEVLFLFEKKRLGAFARKTLFTIELLCKDHVEHVETMIKALCPGRAKQILQDLTDPNGLVQKELALRKRDEERDREADLQLLLTNLQTRNAPPNTPFLLRTPRVKRATIMHGAMVEEPVNETLATQQIKVEENQPNATSTPVQTGSRPTAPTKALTLSAIRSDNLRFVVDSLTPKSKQKAASAHIKPLFAPNLAEVNEDEDELDEPPRIVAPRISMGNKTKDNNLAVKDEPVDETVNEELATASEATNIPENKENEQAEEVNHGLHRADDEMPPATEQINNSPDDEASCSIMDISSTTQKIEPIVAIRKIPLKDQDVEEPEKENRSIRKTTKTLEPHSTEQAFNPNYTNDETMIGGRAFSTPNKDPNNMELTFAGLDYSVIQKAPGTTRQKRTRSATSEQNDKH